eukprot:3803737-Amphidinium_carterae.1
MACCAVLHELLTRMTRQSAKVLGTLTSGVTHLTSRLLSNEVPSRACERILSPSDALLNSLPCKFRSRKSSTQGKFKTVANASGQRV